MDFTVISRAALTQGEFAALVGVSRVTANLWVRGKMQPHRYTKAKVAVVLEHLQSAIEHGDLPFTTPPKVRVDELRAIVKSAVVRARESSAH